MTHDIYEVSILTVPSEYAFSASNRVLTDDRNRLGNKIFEMLVCLKD
jgi:hAT family C-terminal dimerisation region